MKLFSPLFKNFDRNFGTLGVGIVKIRLQIRTRRPRMRLYVNFVKFGYIISVKNNQSACFVIVTLYFGHFSGIKTLRRGSFEKARSRQVRVYKFWV